MRIQALVLPFALYCLLGANAIRLDSYDSGAADSEDKADTTTKSTDKTTPSSDEKKS